MSQTAHDWTGDDEVVAGGPEPASPVGGAARARSRPVIDEEVGGERVHERLVTIARELKRLAALDHLMQSLAAARSTGAAFQQVLVGLPGMIEQICRAEIFLADAHGSLARAAGTGEPDPEGSLLQAICHNDTSALTLHGPKRWRVHGQSAATAPLVASDEVLGVLVLERAAGAEELDEADLQTLGSVATQLCMVLQRLRAEERSRMHHIRFENDLEMARRIQRRFLPPLPVQVGGLRVAAEYRPAFEVGGDFYDLVPMRDGGLLAAIGDVSGKGIAAALIMARVTSELRRTARYHATPGPLLAEVNRLLVDIGHDDAFVTAACVRFDVTRTRVHVANAGHVPPIVRRASGETLVLGEATGAPLAMLPNEKYEDQEFQLDPGDIVLLLTDGITEAVDKGGNPLDMGRILSIVASAPHHVGAISARILDEVDRAASRRPDDLALLALQVPA